MTLSELRNLNIPGLEAEVARLILERVAQDLPELTDYSPGSPHVVIAEAVAWAVSLALYYGLSLPEAVEEYLVRYLMGASEAPARAARAGLVLQFSSPAPSGGRTLPTGTAFQGGGLTWVTLEPFTYPAGSYGNETSGGNYLYVVPVVATVAGTRGNIPANTITSPAGVIPGLVSVTNPLPAYGGRDTETYTQMRDRVLRTPTDYKLITPDDYNRFIRDYLGGGRAYVITPKFPDGLTDDPEWQAGKVSVSAILPDGTGLSSDPVLKGILDAASPLAPVRFVVPIFTPISLQATVGLDGTRAASEVQTDVMAALNALLSPLSWPYWGKWPNTVYRSAIISAIQAVQGVRYVNLTSPSNDVALSRPYAVPQASISLTLV